MTTFSVNQATFLEIAHHLAACDSDFVPPLSQRVDINAYATKITAQGTRFEIWEDGTLIGLIAAYCNDSETKIAFVTSVSLLKKWRSKGLMQLLMDHLIHHVSSIGFNGIELEVDAGNGNALRLYERIGFEVVREIKGTKKLFLQLQRSDGG